MSSTDNFFSFFKKEIKLFCVFLLPQRKVISFNFMFFLLQHLKKNLKAEIKKSNLAIAPKISRSIIGKIQKSTKNYLTVEYRLPCLRLNKTRKIFLNRRENHELRERKLFERDVREKNYCILQNKNSQNEKAHRAWFRMFSIINKWWSSSKLFYLRMCLKL